MSLITADSSNVGLTEGAGSPTFGFISLDATLGVRGATKYFGVFGQYQINDIPAEVVEGEENDQEEATPADPKNLNQGYEYRESEKWSVLNGKARMNNDKIDPPTSEESYLYGQSFCQPSIVLLNVYVKDAEFVQGEEAKLELTLSS